MSDETNENVVSVTGKSLLDQVKNELQKGEREAVKSKVKDLQKKKFEHEKAIRQIDVELNKLISDFESGIL